MISPRTTGVLLSLVCFACMAACGKTLVLNDAGGGSSASGEAGQGGGGGSRANGGSGASGEAGQPAADGGSSGSGAGGAIGVAGASDESGAGGGNGGAGGAVPPTVGPSCDGDPGADETSCTLLLVPGGTYKRSYDGVYALDDTNPATVSSFYLEKYEVTVGRYRAFLAAGWSTQSNPPPTDAGAHPKVPGSGWKAAWKIDLAPDLSAAIAGVQCDPRSTFTNAQSYETWPVPCVTWFEAFAFCAWDGGRLPTEAEWNRAAAGGDEQRVYPWSSPPNSAQIVDAQAVYGFNSGTNPPFPPVGSKPAGAGKWGHLDLAGSVGEWVLDTSNPPYANPCLDCINESAPGGRGVRGGDWTNSPNLLTASSRFGFVPTTRNIETGFRCVKDL
jgi:formylglycine-generating enzyme required for sulfatase activity